MFFIFDTGLLLIQACLQIMTIFCLNFPSAGLCLLLLNSSTLLWTQGNSVWTDLPSGGLLLSPGHQLRHNCTIGVFCPSQKTLPMRKELYPIRPYKAAPLNSSMHPDPECQVLPRVVFSWIKDATALLLTIFLLFASIMQFST